MMKNIKVLIVDDEALARDLIKTFLATQANIELVGEASNGFDGFKMIGEHKPDLVFLDIMMPKLTGFELLELLEDPPVIIFSTAYDEYAIKAFEKNAVDYLLKPYTEERLLEAVEKACAVLSLSKSESRDNLKALSTDKKQKDELLTRVAVRTGNKIQIVSVDDIKFIEAQDDYVKIHTARGVFLKQLTMKYLESHLPLTDFHRIHRSFIVSIKEIAKLEPMGKDTHVVVLHDDTVLNVSRSGYSTLKKVLQF